MVSPTVDEYSRIAGRGQRVPLRRRIPADLETPVSAFLKLKPLGATFLLESVEQGIQVGRYSFIGIGPMQTIRLVGGTVEIRSGMAEGDGDGRDGRDGGDGGDAVSRRPVDPQDPFAPVREQLARYADLTGDDLPAAFAGAVGYLGYEVVRYFENVPVPDEPGMKLPDYCFLIPLTLAVFDHVKSEIEFITLPADGEPGATYRQAETRIEQLLGGLQTPIDHGLASGRDVQRKSLQPNMTEESFHKRVERAKEHILAGDAFQIVLSQRLAGETTVAPFQIYRALRILNPSPYMFFIDYDDFQIIGSSPEVLVKLESRHALVCPIAGTRPRGDSPQRDQELEEELIANEKERAEHVMLVDLGRNDLGRVCEIGSVQPESLMHIEKYSHVMHIVSRVTGTLKKEHDMFDLLRATFPAGTVTGAPKIRAMEIIRDLEGDARGPYAGAVGYFGRQGDMDLCITIRTLVMQGTTFYAQAGAGIVADSDPAAEYQETLNKIRAVTRAIEIAEEGF